MPMLQYTDISMMDVSQGYLTHEWIVPENRGVYFISEDLDSDVGPVIIPNANYTTSASTIHLYFDEWSEENVEIRLLNTYDKQVSYTYQVSSEDYTTYSQYINGVHVADTTFRIRVYSSTMTPQARIFRYRTEKGGDFTPYNGTTIDDNDMYRDISDSYDYAGEIFYKNEFGVPLPYNDDASNVNADEVTTVTVPYGKSLYFLDDSYDSPDVWTWTNSKNNSFTSSESEVEMPFNIISVESNFSESGYSSATTYDYIRLAVQRSGSSTSVPSGSTKTITLPVTVIVTGSYEVVTYDVEMVGDNIQITLQNAAFTSTVTEQFGAFSAKFTNSFVDNNGTGHQTDDISGTVYFSEIEYSSSTPNVITLVPESRVYNEGADDEVTIKGLFNTDEITLYWDNNNNIELVNNEYTTVLDKTDGVQGVKVASTVEDYDIFHDFEEYDLNHTFSSTDFEWTLLQGPASTSVTSGAWPMDLQPQVVADPTGRTNPDGTANQVLKVWLSTVDAMSYSEYNPYLIIGDYFRGTVTNNLRMSFQHYSETGEIADPGGGTQPIFYMHVIPPGSMVTQDIDPSTAKWDFYYAYSAYDYTWLQYGDSGTSIYITLQTTRDAWRTTSTDASGAHNNLNKVFSGLNETVEGDDLIFLMRFNRTRGWVYFDNIILRNVELRPNIDGTIGYYGTDVPYYTFYSTSSSDNAEISKFIE